MIVGNARAVGYLSRLLAQEKLPHGFLFFGPEGIGKRMAAALMAQSLFCTTSGAPFGGCGQCEDCRLVSAGTHPDFLIVSPAHPISADDSEGTIGIGGVREIGRVSSMTTWRSHHRVVLIDDAHTMTRDAQHGFLKTLEEPTPGTIIILVTALPGLLADTIRSRVMPISFRLLTNDELMQLAPTPAPRNISTLLRTARGRASVLVKLLHDSGYRKTIDASRTRAEELLAGDLSVRFRASEKIRDEGTVALLTLGEEFLMTLYERASRELDSEESFTARSSFLALRDALEGWVLLSNSSLNRRLILDRLFFRLPVISS
jgi:DNA polymerase-3 subunit delta'